MLRYSDRLLKGRMTNPVLIALVASATFCAYDAASNKPNPLGMRSFVYIYSATPRLTRFFFDDFGNAVGDGAAKCELTIHATLSQARAIMRRSPQAWAALTGAPEADPKDDTYARLDAILKCSPVKVSDLRRVNDPLRVKVTFSKA